MEETEAPPVSSWRLALGPLLALVVSLAPLDLAANAHLLLAILVWAVCYWVTEAIPAPATALLASMLCVLSGLGSIKDVLAPFGDPGIWLDLLGALLIWLYLRIFCPLFGMACRMPGGRPRVA